MLRLALQDLILSPVQSFLSFGAIYLLTLSAAVVVLIGEFVVTAVDDVVRTEPSVVVARADRAPMPIEASIRRLGSVPGVLGVWPRIHDRVRNRRPGEADDMAVHVFHPSETAALLPELKAALPWPVTLTTRADLEGARKTRIGHRLSLFLFLLAPGLLALMLITLGRYRSSKRELFDIGVLKSLGWSSADILKRYAIQAMLLGGVAGLFGLTTAVVIVSCVHLPVVQTSLLGSTHGAWPVALAWEGVLRTVFTVMILVLTPFFAASLVPVARGVLVDPGLLLSRGR